MKTTQRHHRWHLYIFVVLVTITCCIETDAQSYTDIDNLVTAVLTGYNTKVRPLADQSQVLSVSVTFQPAVITEFDIVKQTITIAAVVKLSWIDEKIRWDPALYGNVNKLTVPKADVWTPPVVLSNPATSELLIGQSWMYIVYNSSGHATYEAGQLLSATCPLDVSNWPFDQQTCSLSFLSVGYHSSEVSCTSRDVDLIYFEENGEWELTSSSALSATLGHLSFATIRLNLRRRPTFLIVNLLLPVIFLMALSVCVFLLPPGSGERVSYSITVLLSIAVFLGVINDYLPSVSQNMATVTYYIMSNFFVSVLIFFGTMLSLRLHMKPGTAQIPQWCSKCLKLLLSCNTQKNGSVQPETFGKSDEVQDLTVNAPTTDDFMKPEPVTMQTDQPFIEEEVTWKKLGETVDKIQFSVFSLAIVSLALWFMIIISIRT